ncbi:MAG: D-glycero-beta-D-manno-heptose 1-phosphate adenylyltransferase [Bacteroidales bacterium]|nr:D-glycero-beta-D-manno-heptose 1-phosphate adenylyltransferase [Bacteroidales bacterium]
MRKTALIQGKIRSGIELERWLTIVRFKKQKIVFTNGCFDILHKGHIQYLAEASELGDYLVIGLNTDASVRKLKGNGRPYLDEESRARILASLYFVSVIVLFDEETPLNLIRQIRPDVLVKGADYKPEDIVGGDFVRQYGGEVVTLNLVEGSSTSEIISKINSGSD